MKLLKSIRLFSSLIILFLLSISFLTGCSSKEPLSKTDLYFDTVIQITLYDHQNNALIDGCFQIADKYEKLFSTTIEGSDIWNINHAKGNPVAISSDTYALLQEMKTYGEATNGKLDLTIGPVSDLWNFSSANSSHQVPSAKAIEEKLSHVNYANLQLLQTDTCCLASLSDPVAAVDLGCIAKGYIADQMKTYLLENQVSSAIINLGGNVLTIGSKPDKKPFLIGIEKPFDKEKGPITTVEAMDKSVVTSGIYERFFEDNGILYHHVLDTQNGYPIQNDLYSVTILSDSSMEGDALSTTCLILGLEDGMAFIEEKPGVEAIFITRNNEIFPTSGIKR